MITTDRRIKESSSTTVALTISAAAASALSSTNKDDIEPLENITRRKLQEYQRIWGILQDENRRLNQKLRIKKTMREARRAQLLNFFDCCIQELERCKRNYLIDMENNDMMFEQEFDTLQQNINGILEIVSKETIGIDTVNEFCSYDTFIKTKSAHDDIVKYIQNFIDESEVTEIGDYIISFNREDLKNRIDALWNSSLVHKQNTTLFDFDFLNNRIIKTEILGKGSLKDFLTDEGDEYKVTGLRDLNSFVSEQQMNKSLVNSASTSNLDRAKVIHERNKSSISLFLEQKNLLKNPVSEEQYK